MQSLHDALHREQREIWVDWQAIPLTADWWQEIERGIEGTNTFVFVISPDSVASDICRQEIDHAVKHNKRLVPIVHREGFEAAKVHPMLSKHNWLFFRQTDDFAHGFEQLTTAIDTDLDQVRTHTRILEKAIEWKKEGRNPSFVLRGEDLVRSQAWLVQSDQQQPKPTELQREYIRASQTSEEAAAILLRAGRRATRMVQIGAGVLVATLIGAGVAGGLALKATKDATTATQKARETEQQADQKVTTAQHQADAITQQADRHVKAADAKLKAADAKAAQAQKAVTQAKAEQARVLAQSERQIRAAQGQVAQAEQQRQAASEQAKVAEQRRQQADAAVRVAENQQKAAVALQVEAKAGTQIERLGSIALRRFDVDQADGLRLAMQAGFELQKWGQGKSLDQYPALSPILALQSGLEKIKGTRLPGNQGIVRSVAFSPDGSRIATGGDDGSTKLWDRDGKPITTINSDQDGVYSVAFSPDGSRIATGGYDGSTKLWDRDGKPITSINSNQGIVNSVAFSPDGSRIATGGYDGSTKLWDRDGKPITSINSNQGIVNSVAFSPDGSRIAIGGLDGSTKLWDRDGKPITSINSNQGIVNSVAFSPDGSRIAIGGLDGSTKLWDRDGKPITSINSNQGIVNSVAFSPDGSRIAIGGLDGSTKLWDRDGNQLGQFEGGSPTFSLDWQTIAIVTRPSYFGAPLPDSKNSIVKLYRIDLNLDSLLRRACQRLKTYILDDPKQTTEQKQCETQLGESWQAQRTSK